MSDVPPDRQCTLPTCEREATDPTDPTPVCETHLAAVSGDEEPEDTTTSEPSDESIREHYHDARDALAPIATFGDAPTGAFVGNFGWYQTRPITDVDDLEDGWTDYGRVKTLARDYQAIAADARNDTDARSLYALTTYSRAALEPVRCRIGDDGREWEGDANPLPEYGEIDAIAPFADVDLADEYKERPLPEDRRDLVETALKEYRDAFADLMGGPGGVFMLDSVGGAYLFGAPAATRPIAERYDREDRERIFSELMDRLNDWLEGVATDVNSEFPALEGVFEPDYLNNKNRQYKAPLSVHKSIDGVVHPIDVDSPAYEFTPLDDVDDDLRDETREWGERFTDPDHADRVGALVETLWREYYDREDVATWKDALDAWLEEQRERRLAKAHQRALDERRQRERLAERRETLAEQAGKDPADVTVDDALADLEVTSVRKDVFDALEKRAVVDVRAVIRAHCSDEWDTSSRDHETTFDPSWRPSGSGKSCAVPNGSNAFVDNGCDGGGGPAKAYALGNGILPRTDTAAAKSLTGRRWGEAIDGLRRDGYDIPVYVPEAGDTNGDGEEYDQTPLWALRNAAVALDVCGPDDFREQETDDGETYLGFDRETYNATLEALGAEGINHGREPMDGEDADAVSALPIGQLDALDPAERRRYAKRRGLEWPTTDEARTRLFETVAEVLRNEDDRVVDAPTSLGKTHTVAATRWGARSELTDGRPVVHLLETRDARDEAIDVAEEKGGQYHVLLGRHEACPVAAGEHDDDLTLGGEPASEWLDAVCDGKGLPFSTAHRYLEEHNDQDETLPCCDDAECHGVKQWDTYREGPEGDLEYWPLVIATHNFAFAPGLRTANNVVIDEQPSYEQDLSTDRVRRAVGAYLREINAPVSTWEAFIQLSRIDQYGTDAAKERDALEDAIGADPDREWYFTDPDAHILAPALARAIFRSEDRANGRRFGKTVHEPPRLEAGAREDDDWNREWVSVVLDEANDVRSVRVVPDFGSARSVVGLDAHPATPLWQANTVPWIKPKEVLEPDARQLWRRYERGLRVVQVGDATRPLSGDKALEWLSERKLEALFDHLVDEYGTQFRTCITTAQVEDRVAELMDDAGVHRPDLMHFGEEKSRNDFATERIGLVNGCMDPGDDYVLDLLAELDLNAEAETALTDDGEEYRARGRGFDGPDAETATEILASVRENHTAQAAGRYARSPTDPEATATVFVRTDAVPDRFTDVVVPGVEWAFGEDQQAIVDELRSSTDGRTAREIADEVGCSKEHVRATLKRLSDDENGEPAVRLSPDEGENGATLYAESGVPRSGVCDLGESPTDPYRDSSRWELAIRSPVERGDVDPSPDTPGSADGSAWEWSIGGDSPPDSAG